VLLKKIFNVGFEHIEVQRRDAVGFDMLSTFPVFPPAFLELVQRVVPPSKLDTLVSSVLVTAERGKRT
jgi:hypothetical protein